MTEFIDCGSLSISYNVNGAASVSFVVLKDNDSDIIAGNYEDPSYGSVSFDGVIVRATRQPIIGSGGWNQWQIQVEGVGS